MSNIFLNTVENLIGPDKVKHIESLEDNVSNFKKRLVKGAIQPDSVVDVQNILKIANKFNDITLHPVSTGYNWGLGSKENVSDGSVLVQMNALNEVRQLNIEQGWAVIEPGVTQGELSELLDKTNKMINLTASTANSSFLGNSLDRGVGLRQQRTKDLIGLEIQLPNGKQVRVGWWPGKKSSALYSHGLGPSLVHFFTQSSFGIITAGVIKLIQRPEFSRVLRFTFKQKNFKIAITQLQRWVSQGVNTGVLKIYDSTANQIYGSADKTYTVYMCIDGIEAHVNLTIEYLKKELQQTHIFSDLTVYSHPVNDSDVIVNLITSAHVGDSSSNNKLLQATLGYNHDRIDNSENGWIFFLPLLPFDASSLEEAYEIFDQIFLETNIQCGATINALDESIIDLVVSIKFKKDSFEQEQAHKALNLLHEKFYTAGFMPYRLDIDNAHRSDRITNNVSETEFIKSLKEFIDPSYLISNNRH